jgi:hypothetical protein
VDVHFVQTDAAHLAALRSHIETSGAWRAQMLELAAVGSVPQLNFQMSLGAGAPPAMAMHSMAGAAGAAAPHQRGLLSMGELSSAAHLNRFGASSSPAALLSETGGQQVWQFPLPLRFKDGDMVGIGFTYCSAGTDCDTEASFYRLHEVDDSEKKQEEGRAQDDEQQMQLLRHAQAKAQLDAPLRLAGISQPRLSLSGAAGRSPLITSAHQRLQAALDSDFDLDADDRLSKVRHNIGGPAERLAGSTTGPEAKGAESGPGTKRSWPQRHRLHRAGQDAPPAKRALCARPWAAPVDD